MPSLLANVFAPFDPWTNGGYASGTAFISAKLTTENLRFFATAQLSAIAEIAI